MLDFLVLMGQRVELFPLELLWNALALVCAVKMSDLHAERVIETHHQLLVLFFDLL